MSAGIKQRLAAIIAAHEGYGFNGWVGDQINQLCDCGYEFLGSHAEHAEHVAASIVESLALKRETDGESWRWSTDWEAE